MPIFSKKYRAFTLAELLLVMAIIGIMSAILFASLTSNRSTSRLKTAQREVASTIKLAQTYALQGNKQGGITPCGYGVKFTNSTNYQIFYNEAGNYGDCTARNEAQNGRHWFNGFPNSSIQAESYSLKNGASLCINPPCTNLASSEVYFIVPHATAFDQGGNEFDSTHPPLVLTLDFSGAQKRVTFSAGGSVNESQ